jgi:hypothetical protein
MLAQTARIVADTAPGGWWLIAAGAVGAAVAIVGSLLTHWLARRAFVADRARTEARAAYTDFLVDSNYCAHLIGNLCPSAHRVRAPSDDERREAQYYFDSSTSAKFRVVELAGSARGVAAAASLRTALRDFRDEICTNDYDELPLYPSDEYDELYEPFLRARARFVSDVRGELHARPGRFARDVLRRRA